MEKEKLKGIVLVLAGAVSYGILATIVKYANGLGIHTSVLTFFQFLIGVVVLFFINVFYREKVKITAVSKRKLTTWGVSLGMTTTLYYLAIQYIPVSVGIILLMQSIWMSIVLEGILLKKVPANIKIIGAVCSIIGTLLATNLFSSEVELDWRGLLLGIGAGLSYTISLYSSSSIEKQYQNYTRSLYLVLGGLLFITLFWNYQIVTNVSWNALAWGSILALFGTVLPPLLFTAGIPRTGIGVGSIISSVEIPVSILSASLVLQDKIVPLQWIGVLVILLSVIIVNSKKS